MDAPDIIVYREQRPIMFIDFKTYARDCSAWTTYNIYFLPIRLHFSMLDGGENE
jgi:hypothetical protein